MTAIENLRDEVESSELIGIVVNDIASALVDAVRQKIDIDENYSMPPVPAEQYSRILFKLKLLNPNGYGDPVTFYDLTEKGEEYGRKLLQERQGEETVTPSS